jgi:hypothetical protein
VQQLQQQQQQQHLASSLWGAPRKAPVRRLRRQVLSLLGVSNFCSNINSSNRPEQLQQQAHPLLRSTQHLQALSLLQV